MHDLYKSLIIRVSHGLMQKGEWWHISSARFLFYLNWENSHIDQSFLLPFALPNWINSYRGPTTIEEILLFTYRTTIISLIVKQLQLMPILQENWLPRQPGIVSSYRSWYGYRFVSYPGLSLYPLPLPLSFLGREDLQDHVFRFQLAYEIFSSI